MGINIAILSIKVDLEVIKSSNKLLSLIAGIGADNSQVDFYLIKVPLSLPETFILNLIQSLIQILLSNLADYPWRIWPLLYWINFD